LFIRFLEQVVIVYFIVNFEIDKSANLRTKHCILFCTIQVKHAFYTFERCNSRLVRCVHVWISPAQTELRWSRIFYKHLHNIIIIGLTTGNCTSITCITSYLI